MGLVMKLGGVLLLLAPEPVAVWEVARNGEVGIAILVMGLLKC